MRLIDADRIIKRMQARYAEIEKEYTYYDSYVQGYGEALDVVENAPTVEPAESVKAKRGLRWTGKRQPKEDQYPAQMKLRYEKQLRKEDEGK